MQFAYGGIQHIKEREINSLQREAINRFRKGNTVCKGRHPTHKRGGNKQFVKGGLQHIKEREISI